MKKLLLLVALSSFFVLFVNSCSDSSTSPTKPAKDIDELVRNAGELPTVPQAYSRVEKGNQIENTTFEGQNYISDSKLVSLSNKFDEIVAFNSAYADVLYPGSIVQGKDLFEGKLTSVGNFPREPITITIQGGASKEIVNPSLANVTTGVTELLAKSNKTPAQMQFNKTELYNADQAFLSLGLDVNWLAGQLSAKFQSDKSIKKKSVFLYFKQVFYTVSANSLTTPSDYFSSNTNLEQMKSVIYQGNPPCYISSVSYGRIIIVKMTSEDTYENMMSNLEGSYKIVNGKAQFETNNVLSKSTFDAIIVGGSSKGAAEAITSGNLDSINALIRRDAEFSADNPGFPISYSVRYLNGGSPVKLGKTTEYLEQNWQIDESKYDKYDVFIGRFIIRDDSYVFKKGKFYYSIWLSDKNGNIMKDRDGNQYLIQTQFFYAEEVGTGEELIVNKQFKNVLLPKKEGENVQIMFKLYDFADGDQKVAGNNGMIYYYPWSTSSKPILNDQWIILSLSEGDFKTDVKYRFVKL